MNFRFSKKWEEKKIFEFRKSDIYNPMVGIGSPAFDPYPNNDSGDIVERRVIGQEFLVQGEHESNDPIKMADVIESDGLKYIVISLHQELPIAGDLIKSTFVASHIEPLVEPLQLLEIIRREKMGPGHSSA